MSVNDENNTHAQLPYSPSSDSTTDLITFEHTWTIKNISRLCSATIAGFPVLYSPIFIAPPDKITTENKKPVKFQLTFYPKGNGNDFVCMYLELKNCPGLDILYIHSLVKTNGEKRVVASSLSNFDEESMSWGTSRAIRRDELYNPANGFVSKGNVTLHCEVNILMSKLVKPDLCDQLQHKHCQPEHLAKSFGDLLESGSHSNVTLVLVDDGGQELRAHKEVLIARSRVFADMFESGMAESTTNRIEIVETRVEVFKEVLKFIYTGKVASLDAIAQDLLICADKYQLDPLKSICEEFLSSNITTQSNLSDLFALAILHDASHLKAKVALSILKKLEDQPQNVEKMMKMDQFLFSLATDKND